MPKPPSCVKPSVHPARKAPEGGFGQKTFFGSVKFCVGRNRPHHSGGVVVGRGVREDGTMSATHDTLTTVGLWAEGAECGRRDSARYQCKSPLDTVACPWGGEAGATWSAGYRYGWERARWAARARQIGYDDGWRSIAEPTGGAPACDAAAVRAEHRDDWAAGAAQGIDDAMQYYEGL